MATYNQTAQHRLDEFKVQIQQLNGDLVTLVSEDEKDYIRKFIDAITTPDINIIKLRQIANFIDTDLYDCYMLKSDAPFTPNLSDIEWMEESKRSYIMLYHVVKYYYNFYMKYTFEGTTPPKSPIFFMKSCTTNSVYTFRCNGLHVEMLSTDINSSKAKTSRTMAVRDILANDDIAKVCIERQKIITQGIRKHSMSYNQRYKLIADIYMNKKKMNYNIYKGRG